MATLHLTTAIGSPFDVRRFSIREAISEAFEIDILAMASDPNIDLEAVAGKPATFHIEPGYLNVFGVERMWSGVVSHAEQVIGISPRTAGSKVLSTYAIRLVPQMWLLTQRTNNRIFQHVSIPEIVRKVLGDAGVQMRWKIDSANYPPLEYKVQYGETDWAFVNRLLEEAGISYVFADEDTASVVLLSDKLTSNPKRAGDAIHYEDNPTEAAEREFVTRLRLSHEVRPGARQIADFDFRNPSFRLFAESPKSGAPENEYEQYEYLPGSFLVEGGKGGTTPVADDKGVARYEGNYGKERAERMLVAERTGKRTVIFETNVVDLAPGTIFAIDNHPHEALSSLLMAVAMDMRGTHDDKWDMVVRSVFKDDPFRPPLRTPKPRVFAHRAGGARRLPRRRPRSADHRGARL